MKASSLIENIDVSIETIFIIESILKSIQESCYYKEMISQYYDLSLADSKLLSEERNHYINLISISLEKVSKIKKHLNFLEQNSYNSSR